MKLVSGSSVGKESALNVGDPGLTPGSGGSSGEGIDYSLQYSWASLVAQSVRPGLGRPPRAGDSWLHTPVWSGEFHGQRSLAGDSSWGR